MMILRRETLKIFLICSFLIVISSGRSTHRRQKYNDEDDGVGDNDSDLYFNGDEDASSKLLQITENDLPSNGDLFEGDMVMDNRLRRAVLGEESKKAAVLVSEDGGDRHWHNGRVPYIIDDSLIAVIAAKIPIAIQIFNHFTCVRFVPKQPYDIDFFKFADGTGCSSSVGRTGGEQIVHLGKGCKRLGTIMHEMMHVLGIIHEQSRPDRDDYLKINFKNIKKGLLPNFQKYSFDQADTLSTAYNYYSVMHYSNYAFSKNDEVTLEAKLDKDLDFGQRKMISHLDAKEINKLYSCTGKDVYAMNPCIEIPLTTAEPVCQSEIEGEGKQKCCLHNDKTAAIILDEKRRRKDALKRKDEWERVWKDLLIDYLRDGESRK